MQLPFPVCKTSRIVRKIQGLLKIVRLSIWFHRTIIFFNNYGYSTSRQRQPRLLATGASDMSITQYTSTFFFLFECGDSRQINVYIWLLH